MALGKTFTGSNFELVNTKTGVLSIKNILLNEIMHNPVGPWTEANDLYVRQTRLREKLTDKNHLTETLVLFDVGLGAGTNALAALETYLNLKEKSLPVRPFKIVSFEQDLTLMDFTLAHAASFEHVTKYKKFLENLLAEKKIVDGAFSWELRLGHFPDLIEEEIDLPEIIFYDPYSPKVNSEMWSSDCFKKLYALAARSAFPTYLVTYSRATPVRVSLFLAGFFVGGGVPSGLKDETTEASTSLSELSQPFGQRWFQRWQRSDTPFPPKFKEEWPEGSGRAEIEQILSRHPQFSGQSLVIDESLA